MLKDTLVHEEKWISIPKFNRVFAVYQVLPGPEATELCCYFGYLAGGRIGSVLAGIAFLVPGFISILFFSWVYTLIGTTNVYFNASFKALQPLVAAMFIKAVDRIGQDTIYHHETNQLNIHLFLIALLAALNTALNINMLITLSCFGVAYAFLQRGWKAGYLIVLIQYIIYAIFVSTYGFPSDASLTTGIAATPHPFNIFLLGLVAGSLSFGGAYTTIPIILQEAVIRGGWINRQTFLDGVAIANVLPAPTVIFSTFVGFIGGKVFSGGDASGKGGDVGYGILGAILMTLGMFFAPFLFAVVGHPILERIATMKSVHALFDGITAAVVGLIACTSLQILKSSITTQVGTPMDVQQLQSINENTVSVAILGITLYIMYNYKFKNQSLVLVGCTALAGQFLFI